MERGAGSSKILREETFLRIVNSSWNLQSEMCTTSLGYFRLISIRINIGSGLIRCNRIIIKKYFDTSLLLRFSNDWTTSSTTIFIDGCKLAVGKQIFVHSALMTWYNYVIPWQIFNSRLYITILYAILYAHGRVSKLQKQITWYLSINYPISYPYLGCVKQINFSMNLFRSIRH